MMPGHSRLRTAGETQVETEPYLWILEAESKIRGLRLVAVQKWSDLIKYAAYYMQQYFLIRVNDLIKGQTTKSAKIE